VAFSPDGGTLAVGGDDGVVTLWDVEAREKATLKGHTNRVTAILFAPDGKSLVTGSWDVTVKVWDVASGRLRMTLAGEGSVLAVTSAPDGKTLVAAYSRQRTFREGGPQGIVSKIEESSEVRLWKTETGQAIRTFEVDPGRGLVGLAVTVDGKQLITMRRDGTVKEWSLASLTQPPRP
jgi:WD40 repeat protein